MYVLLDFLIINICNLIRRERFVLTAVSTDNWLINFLGAEELTKDEIITALSRTLSNLIKERDEEMEEDEEEYIDDNGEDQVTKTID